MSGSECSQLGLSLSYIIPLQQSFSFVVRQFTMTEQNLNSAERLLHYANELGQEAAYERPDNQVEVGWPRKGKISFQNVTMAYRPGLPLVLRGLSFDVAQGESIGICGRTGMPRTHHLCDFVLVSKRLL